jgi:hypothetical protein
MDDEGSFVRWQATTNTQLGYVIGLILSLTTASLGFAIVLLERLMTCPRQVVAAILVTSSTVVLLISGALAIARTINRLCDFRRTTRIARSRAKWRRKGVTEREISHKLLKRRAETKRLGKRTWCLFFWQIGTFAFGITMLFAGIMFYFEPLIHAALCAL